jgi:futalosine hydrolase
MRVIVITAVAAERDAIVAALPAHAPMTVVVSGVGPAAAAAAAARAVDGADLVLSAGIGGGFTPLQPGDIAVASDIVFADLGAESPEGFLPLSTLGFDLGPSERHHVEPKLAVELVDRTGGHLGTVLTVATVTGTADTCERLRERFPDAVAEGMEGAGVATAAAAADVPFGEIRAISNLVGPRDRSAWQIPAALEALGRAVAAVTR